MGGAGRKVDDAANPGPGVAARAALAELARTVGRSLQPERTTQSSQPRGGCRDHAALVELAGAVGQSSQPAWTARGSQFAWLVAVRPWRSSKTMRTAPRSRALRRGAHLTELVGACLPTLLC
jgi:hypothetical protein